MAQHERKRPGVMVYFDIMPALSLLDDSEKGRLFTAILSYGSTGVEPELDGKVAVAWAFMRNASDRDAARYDERVLKTKYAAYCRITKCKDPESGVLSYQDWKNEFVRQENESPDGNYTNIE